MLTVKTIVLKSPIHGLGLFADEPIPAGKLVWRFVPGTDKIIPKNSATKVLLDLGYVNPRNPDKLVVCGDAAQFLNFNGGEPPNLFEIVTEEGESDLIAVRNIERGEELTVAPSTDADYKRKMEGKQ
jgi:hypothetical protein